MVIHRREHPAAEWDGAAPATGGRAAGVNLCHEPAWLRVRLLGAFQVWLGGQAVSEAGWRLRKARSVVKLLALAPEYRLHREQIAEVLWPGLDSDAALNN